MKLKILLFSVATVFSANAATVAYYQFDDATAGTNASTLASDVNSPALNGTASSVGTGALLPAFSSATVGSVITSGIGGAVTNSSNTTSLEFFNGNGGTADAGSATGGRVTINGSTTFNSSSFTMEGFIKVDTFINYSTIFSKTRSTAGGNIAWQLDTDASGKLRARFDTSPDSKTATGDNQGIASSGVISDGLWHHVALTYDGTTRATKIFMDYNQVGSGTVTNPIYFDSGNVTFGSSGGSSRSFDGLIDEARYTDSVLATSDFLRAVPEPSSALLVIGTACLSLLVRKRY